MPKSEKERRTAFGEIKRRRAGKGKRYFKGMTMKELELYARKPLHK